MQAGKVFTVFCGILSAHHSEIPHLRKAQPLHAGWSSLPAQAFDFDGETVIPIGNGNSSAHLTVPRSSHSAHEREQQQFLPWNQSHNPEARGEIGFQEAGLDRRSFQGSEELPRLSSGWDGWHWQGKTAKQRKLQGFPNTQKWLFFHYTSENKNHVSFKAMEKKHNVTIRSKQVIKPKHNQPKCAAEHRGEAVVSTHCPGFSLLKPKFY